jgi:hypothetical protein
MPSWHSVRTWRWSWPFLWNTGFAIQIKTPYGSTAILWLRNRIAKWGGTQYFVSLDLFLIFLTQELTPLNYFCKADGTLCYIYIYIYISEVTWTCVCVCDIHTHTHAHTHVIIVSREHWLVSGCLRLGGMTDRAEAGINRRGCGVF